MMEFDILEGGSSSKAPAVDSSSPKTVEGQIIALCRKYNNNLPQEALQSELKGIPLQAQAQAINTLLSKGRLSVLKDGTSLVYREIAEDMAAKFHGLGAEEMMIYQLIEQSSNMGIWTRDLRIKSGLIQSQMTKYLKSLETRKLIKSVKSIAGKNKKVYMLFHLEPSRDVTGGAWYNEQEFDSEFINVLLSQCYQFILSKRFASTEQVSEHIRGSGISRVDLRIEDVESLINTLIFDGKIEEVVDMRSTGAYEKSKLYYKVSGFPTPRNNFTDVPCAVCPVFNECSETGDISPATCVYYKKWLEF